MNEESAKYGDIFKRYIMHFRDLYKKHMNDYLLNEIFKRKIVVKSLDKIGRFQKVYLN